MCIYSFPSPQKFEEDFLSEGKNNFKCKIIATASILP